MFLYKQYLTQDSDIKLINAYSQICDTLNKSPAIFTDSCLIISDLLNTIAIFHTLYITKIHKNNIILTTSSEDLKILESMGVSKENAILVKDIENTQEVISQIKELENAKLR